MTHQQIAWLQQTLRESKIPKFPAVIELPGWEPSVRTAFDTKFPVVDLEVMRSTERPVSSCVELKSAASK